MRTLIADVSAFHAACDVPLPDTLGIPAPERVRLRAELIREEVQRELLPALEVSLALTTARAAGTMVVTQKDEHGVLEDVADAIADSIYVLVGCALEFGIPLDRVWDAVQKANMAKVDPETGKVKKREDGKILKPDGWKPPAISDALLKLKERIDSVGAEAALPAGVRHPAAPPSAPRCIGEIVRHDGGIWESWDNSYWMA